MGEATAADTAVGAVGLGVVAADNFRVRVVETAGVDATEDDSERIKSVMEQVVETYSRAK